MSWIIEFRWTKSPNSLVPYTSGGEWANWAHKSTLEEAIEYLMVLVADNAPNKSVYLNGTLGVRLRKSGTTEIIPAELLV